MIQPKPPGSERLKSFVERIAALHEERKAIGSDITDVLLEAKGEGYIPKTLRKVVARYMADPAKLAEEDDLLETYEAALGRVGRALAAVHAGATWDEASKEHDVPRATLARAAAVSKQREVIPEIGVGEIESQPAGLPPEDNTTERPALQEVGAPSARPEGTSQPLQPTTTADPLTIPTFLDQRRRA